MRVDPTPNNSTKLLKWKAKSAQVMFWILEFVEHFIVINLKSYKIA